MLRTFLICLLLSFSAPALAIYKCVVDGKVSYGQKPCPDGNSIDLGDTIESQPPTFDADKFRKEIERQKKEAADLQKARKLREEVEEKAEQAWREAAAKKKKCDELALQGKPILLPNITVGNPRYEAMRDARLAADKLEAECNK